MEKKLKEDRKEDKTMTLARILDALGNPIRLRIVQYLESSGPASWSEIEKTLEKDVGRQNPNTINFHLHRLLIDGIIQKSEGNRYSMSPTSQNTNVIKYILSQVK